MRGPALGAVMCAIAAVALLVGGFTPWFSAGDGEDPYARRRRALDEVRAYDRPGADEDDVRANYGLVSGEVCIDLQCKSSKYTGARGLADDAFAWLGRATMGAVVAGVVLLLAVALAARTHRRAILRGWAAVVAAAAAGLGAAFAASWTFETPAGYVERGMGLAVVIAGAAFAGAGAALPWSQGQVSAARRFALAAAIAVLAPLAWITLVQHAWWRSGGSLNLMHVSPLGVQVCDGAECKISTALGVTTSLRSLATLTSLAAAALIVPAFGAAARIVRGVRPGAWAWTAVVVAMIALGAGLATWAVYPSSDVMRVGWGLPVFALAMAGTAGASLLGALTMRVRDAEVGYAPAELPVPEGGVAPGMRPVLAALGGGPARTPDAPSPYAPSRYAPPQIAATVPAPTADPGSAPVAVPVRDPDSAPVAVRDPGSPPVPVPVRDPGSAAAAFGAMAKTAAAAPRPSPTCPNCRIPTLWHGKRGAWWCSTCKHTF